MSENKLKLEDLLGGIKDSDSPKDQIENIAIIGAGQMGRGIAQTVAASGYEVVVIEQSKDQLEKAKALLQETMEREIARWSMTISEMKAILGRIKWSLNLEEAKEADLVIEAIFEDVLAKQQVFATLDEITPESTIFVSNTASLSLTEISKVIKRKDKLVGMHFLNPVPKIPLVEVIREVETSNDTIEIIKAFAAKLGKTAIEVYEYPGFVTTRAIVPLLNEAMHIYLEGLATAKDIDTAMKLGYKFSSGPLELADAIGLDEVLIWMNTLWNSLGEPRFRPCPILRKLVRERKLGVKTGEGFYKYNEDGKIIS